MVTFLGLLTKVHLRPTSLATCIAKGLTGRGAGIHGMREVEGQEFPFLFSGC